MCVVLSHHISDDLLCSNGKLICPQKKHPLALYQITHLIILEWQFYYYLISMITANNYFLIICSLPYPHILGGFSWRLSFVIQPNVRTGICIALPCQFLRLEDQKTGKNGPTFIVLAIIVSSAALSLTQSCIFHQPPWALVTNISNKCSKRPPVLELFHLYLSIILLIGA